MKIQKKMGGSGFFFFFFFFFLGGGGGGQGRCERRSEAFVKIKKIYIYIYLFFLGGGQVGRRVREWCRVWDGCERRIEVFV